MEDSVTFSKACKVFLCTGHMIKCKTVARNSLNRDRKKIKVKALSQIHKSDAAYEKEHNSPNLLCCTGFSSFLKHE